MNKSSVIKRNQEREVLVEELAVRVRSILETHSGIGEKVRELTPDASLWDAGMESLATVRVVIALEEEFDIAFEDGMLEKNPFDSVSSITSVVAEMVSGR
ncbi:phosphopantetheine-binding protein [Streptomyces sp. NPDC091217]|uniref:phosphopantetheine-binding protein n=1 Tax=Streptomyces sp. NPDC091217 TaxID=3365975 RepID=UPI00381C655B